MAGLTRDEKCNTSLHKLVEKRLELGIQILELLNRNDEKLDAIGAILHLVQENTGIEAVGIRLKEGEDYPYYQTSEFPDEFVERERFLCARNTQGDILRDTLGNPILECMCGNIVSGRTDSALPFFTMGGSFWSNCTTELLASTTEEERQARTRNRCNGEGYESVALIPLRSGDMTIGLLQLNDRRRGMLSLELIEFFERIGASVGVALSRKMAEEALRRSEKRLELVLQGADLGFFDLDLQAEKILINERWAEMLGYSVEEIYPTRQAIWEMIHTKDLPVVTAIFEDHLEGRIPLYEAEYRMRAKNGEWRWVHSRGKVVERDSKGKALRVTGTHLDITERKNFEKELVKAREEAEAAYQTKSRFLSTMSHEIRTPLHAITGISEVLAETPLTEEQKNYVHTFREAGKTLLNTINNILDISKIEAGQLDLEETSFNLCELLDNSIQLFRIKAAHKSIELCSYLQPAIPWCLFGDGYRVGQILVNLLGNAIKFTEQGRITVDVRLEPDPKSVTPARDNKVTLLFSVTDTGIGIPQDKLDTVFRRFNQIDSSTTRKYGGSGLGLTISKSLVELMGGRIWVESTPGQGSRFSFTAQFEPVVAQKSSCDRLTPEKSALLAAREEINKSAALPQAQVLVAEDSKHAQIVVKAFLSKTPVHIDLVDNGQEAVEKYKSSPYDLVLMDVQMPIMDGLAATREIRTWEGKHNRPPVPIIAMTAHAFSDDKKRSLAAGCNSHLSKPMNKKDFLTLVGRYLKAATQNRPVTVQVAKSALPASAGGGEERIPIHTNPVLQALVAEFLESLQQNLCTVRECLEQQDFEQICILGHRMKGDGGTYGFEDVSRLGALIQSAAENRNTTAIENHVVELAHYLKHVELVN